MAAHVHRLGIISSALTSAMSRSVRSSANCSTLTASHFRARAAGHPQPYGTCCRSRFRDSSARRSWRRRRQSRMRGRRHRRAAALRWRLDARWRFRRFSGRAFGVDRDAELTATRPLGHLRRICPPRPHRPVPLSDQSPAAPRSLVASPRGALTLAPRLASGTSGGDGGGGRARQCARGRPCRHGR
jgi:hypothetical protein